ncbi:flavin-dependent oxidoreductase [Actinomadura violacea]|uniref:Flavin-dependent oxidoreductase n=1 Tax=Actinomadura violacea TaxID=2819934 RepID=A0ABS3RVM4_9ACTN|nr:flavin-dependent oxidoreductase [Actinomadura violacea]MBO2460548.1 flavin-dependent oxidoreductase [Actinomadura violacea]
MRVVIAGAGIGGLAAALRLHDKGIDCRIYEQSGQIRELGVGLNLLPNAVKQLAEVGLLERLEDVGSLPDELIYAHRLGQEIMRKPCGRNAGLAYPQVSIHRGRLQSELLRAVRERLGPGAVRTGRRLVGFEQDENGVRAHFRSGEGTASATGDVLVAADGIHSTVRSVLFPDEGPPIWNGVMMWRGAAEWPESGIGRSMLIAGGTDAKLVVYPIAPGRRAGTRLINWVICRRTGRPGDPAPQRQEWSRRAATAGLGDQTSRFRTSFLDHAALVKAVPECFEFPMCDRDPLPGWTRGRVTLLGDAAHPMYPMGSNGAGQAITDAACLADHLAARPGEPAEALRAYQDERLPVTGELVLRNRAGGPENVIDEVERRAPDGFTRLADVMDPAELEAVVTGYARLTGSARDQVNRSGRSDEFRGRGRSNGDRRMEGGPA